MSISNKTDVVIAVCNKLIMYAINNENVVVNTASFIYNDDSILINVEDILYDREEEINNCYIKFDLIDSDGDCESVWGLVSKLNYDKYNSYCKEYITVVLANNTLAGLNWGWVFPIKLVGNKRASFDVRLADENNVIYKAKNSKEDKSN